jgi:hypothetical protein
VYRKIFSNWFYVIHKLRKGEKDIDVVLKNGSKGKCNIKCILTLTTIISQFSFINSRKFNFDDNNRLYYDNNLIIKKHGYYQLEDLLKIMIIGSFLNIM